MKSSLGILMFLICAAHPLAFAEDSTDANFGQIKKIDLSDDQPSSPTHALLTMNLSKFKAGQLAQVTFYQFSKRVRIEFDADLPAGEYVISAAPLCTSPKSAWTQLHSFRATGAHVQTEKSLPKASLSEAKPGHLVLTGKALILSRVKPALVIDCQTLR